MPRNKHSGKAAIGMESALQWVTNNSVVREAILKQNLRKKTWISLGDKEIELEWEWKAF